MKKTEQNPGPDKKVSSKDLIEHIASLCPSTEHEEKVAQFKMMALDIVLDVINWIKKNEK